MQYSHIYFSKIGKNILCPYEYILKIKNVMLKYTYHKTDF